jgi:Ni/Co efflux regulator RcnB
MKRLITTAVLVSLIAGSAAMAGSPPHWSSDPARESQSDSNGWTQNRGHREGRNRDERHFSGGDTRGDDRGERRYARDPRPDARQDDREDHDARWNEPRYRDHVRVDHDRVYARERFRGGYYPTPRGYYYREWRRGERLPAAYFSRPYIVYGYRGYHLYDPPRGYGWVRVGNDVVLTALATGLVLDVVYNLYY